MIRVHVEAAKSTNSVMERIMAKVFMFHVLGTNQDCGDENVIPGSQLGCPDVRR